MILDSLRFLSCPACGESLGQTTQERPLPAEDCMLRCVSCAREWPICSGIPNLTFPDDLSEGEETSRKFWNQIARFYNAINLFTGVLRGVSILEERSELIKRLGLESGSAALEVATGTGNNLPLLTEAVGTRGTIFGLDLSVRMLELAQRKQGGLPQSPLLVSGNSQHLPFSDGVFDAVLDGTGIKYYSDKRQALREMMRVVKPGGKVIVTELGMPAGNKPTLRQRLLLLWIPGFREGPPCDAVPSEAIDVKLDWDARETMFVLEFRRPLSTGTDGAA